MVVHDQHRPPRVGGHLRGDAAGYPAAEPAPPVGAEDDEACLVIVGGMDDRLLGGRSLDRQGLGPESGRIGERGPVRGGLLGGLLDVAGAGRIELGTGLRHEPDAERPPDGQDERVAPGG